MTAVLEEHARYPADHVRIAAYRRALAQVVRPGNVVVDLGSGTGILGLLACEAGAARVYCIDESEMLEVARNTTQKSAFHDRFQFFAGHSTEVVLPERADVVVLDQVASFGVGAGMLAVCADARQRLLKPTGHLLPDRLELWCAGVEHPAVAEQIARIERAARPLDLTPFVEMLRPDPRRIKLEPHQFRTNPGHVTTLQLGDEHPPQVGGSAELRGARGRWDGLGCWFVARLGTDAELTNSPLAVAPIDRELLYLPGHPPPRRFRAGMARFVLRSPGAAVLRLERRATRGGRTGAHGEQADLAGQHPGQSPPPRARSRRRPSEAQRKGRHSPHHARTV